VQEVKNEKTILGKLRHPGIINMKAAWKQGGYYNFLLGYAINGDLSSFLRAQGGRLSKPMV